MTFLVVDMTIESSFVCPNCDVITSASNKCRRCSGPTYPLSRWFQRAMPVEKPQPTEPSCVTYMVMLGVVDDEDQAVSCKEDNRFPCKYLDPLIALGDLEDLVRKHGARLEGRHNSMFDRLSGVVSVWAEVHRLSRQDQYWCIKRIMPKIIQKTS
jgi:hypothetical protein